MKKICSILLVIGLVFSQMSLMSANAETIPVQNEENTEVGQEIVSDEGAGQDAAPIIEEIPLNITDQADTDTTDTDNLNTATEKQEIGETPPLLAQEQDADSDTDEEPEAEDEPQGDQVQMWVGNIVATEGGSSAQGGKVAVKYTPSYDVYPNITAKDGTNYVYGEVLQFYKGDECTVYQQADVGYRFVGWYHANAENIGGLFYTGNPISTDTIFTYKPGVTVVAGDSEPLRYVCAVFEADSSENCTVSFDPGTGTGYMASETVGAGAEYTLPACTFTHTNSERTFYRWSVGDELKEPGDNITVNTDTVVTAKWIYTDYRRIDNSRDISTTEVAGWLVLTDTQTEMETTTLVFDEATASAFTAPSNVTVAAMIEEAKEEAEAEAQEQAAGSPVTIVSEEVSDPSITRTIDNRTYTFFDNGIDEAGDYFTYLIIDGEYYHMWLYGVTVKATYTSHIHTMVPTDEVPATCTDPGTEAYWTCSECEKMFSDENGTTEITAPVAIPALGHDWGAWEAVTEPTAEEEGLEKRVCNRCEEEEERAIPKVTYSVVEGDGAVWTKESGKDLNFTFKRSYKDEETFELAQEIQVDGAAIDESSYSSESGSLKVALKADYLESLSLGDHTITALFDDGSATAKFTVKEASAEKTVTPSDTSGENSKPVTKETSASGKTSDEPATGDRHEFFLWLTLMCLSMLIIRRLLAYRMER